MIEIYHWEDDDEAESLIQELQEKGLEYEVTLLDPEAGGGETAIRYNGKTYWSFDDFRKALS